MYIDGKGVPFVNEYTHIGHVISAPIQDKSDIHLKRQSLWENQQCAICYFTRCETSLKSKLVQYYCYDLHGGVLWDLSQPDVEDSLYTVFQKSDARIQITITTAHLIRLLIILLAALIIAFLAQTIAISTKFTAQFLSNSFF